MGVWCIWGLEGARGDLRQNLVDLINTERAALGRGPLTLHPYLNVSAQGHSEDMLARGYFNHTTPEGKSHAIQPDDSTKSQRFG